MPAALTARRTTLIEPGDIVLIDFPGVTGIKRRPAVVVSTPLYHEARPDFILGLVTSRSVEPAPSDHQLVDWVQAGLKKPSTFRCFLVTLPRPSPVRRLGRLSERDWNEVQARLGSAVAVK
jgi:mRNA interferase MazF